MSTQRPNRHPIVTTILSIIVIVLIAAITLLAINRQRVLDSISAFNFTPTAAIEAIDQKLSLTKEGRLYFYTTHPEVAPAASFNEDCPQQEPGSPILGCYTSGRIYIFDVTDERLDGIEEVTAAHEMLHAAWDRLDQSKKKELSGLLNAQYTASADRALKERMAYYERNEPGELDNELHSILATEVKDLSPALEQYYAQYFTDRQIVVSLHEKYSSVFDELSSRAEQLYSQLTALSKSIDEQSSQYNQASQSLTNDINAFNAKANNDGFSSMSQFNRERASLVTRSSQVDALRASINQGIEQYNTLYNEYQQVASQIEALNGSIDSIKQLDEAPKVE